MPSSGDASVNSRGTMRKSTYSKIVDPGSVAEQFKVHEAKFKRANVMRQETEEMILN